MTNPNNEPAFPYAFEHQDASGFFPGMSLRDYFAAKALQGMLANSEGSQSYNIEHVWAKAAYAQADAMLEVRKQ